MEGFQRYGYKKNIFFIIIVIAAISGIVQIQLVQVFTHLRYRDTAIRVGADQSSRETIQEHQYESGLDPRSMAFYRHYSTRYHEGKNKRTYV